MHVQYKKAGTRCQTVTHGIHVHRYLMVCPGQQEQDWYCTQTSCCKSPTLTFHTISLMAL